MLQYSAWNSSTLYTYSYFNKGCLGNCALVFESHDCYSSKAFIVFCVSMTKSQGNLYWNRCIHTNSLKYQYHCIYMLERGCIVCFSFRPRNRLYLFNRKKITAQQKNILKNWKKGKNDRFPYLCTKKWLFTTMRNSCFQEKVFIFNVRALNMHKIIRSKDARFNLFGLL